MFVIHAIPTLFDFYRLLFDLASTNVFPGNSQGIHMMEVFFFCKEYDKSGPNQWKPDR